ncbi:hypothetical protein L218DRAFT_1001704 [Marasmius fiardii PR-910]|nr:hypothetical protein L218DRAFT_1001704 [Marasmius fiardii PR-910]
MDANLATTYTLIHAFLTKRSHSKAAEALKKAAKEVVILKDGIAVEGPQLDEIIQQWKAMTAKNDDSSHDSSTSSDSDSSSSSSDSDDSSSNSSDSESSDSSETDSAAAFVSAKKTKHKSREPPVPAASSSSSSESESATGVEKASSKPQKSKQHGKKAVEASDSESSSSSSDSSSSSSSDSSDSDSDPDNESVTKKKTAVSSQTSQKSAQDASETMSSGDSSEDSDSSSDSEVEEKESKASVRKDKKNKIKDAANARKEKKAESSDSSSDSGSDSDSSDSDSDNTPPASNKKGFKPSVSTSATPKALEEQDVKPTKKRRISESGTGIPTAVVSTVREELVVATPSEEKQNEKPVKNGRHTTERFQRVDPKKVMSHYVLDNRYQNKAAPKNDYGAKAHADLIVTRGAGFRKEKNKKKRGSYKGGEITMESHSFKFT